MTALPSTAPVSSAPMDADSIRREVAAVPFWWHRIDLGHGIVTPGIDHSEERLARLGLPDRLDGKTVLDVGAWDGFFSFAAEKRGAARVVAADLWSRATGGEADAGFQTARRALCSRVEQMRVGVGQLSRERVGVFDVVMCLGVLYHVENPMLALRRLRELTGGLLILDTETDMLHCRRPAWGFYPGAEMRGDPSNWFAPNTAALHGALRAVGFTSVTTVWETGLFHRAARAWKDRRSHGMALWPGLWRGRTIVHASVE